MAKKLAGIGSQMIGATPEVSAPVGIAPPAARSGKVVSQYGDNLNFRVPNEFRRRFRTYAAEHDMKLNEVLYEAFEALLHAKP